MSKNLLVPGYYDGQDRDTTPVFFKSHQEIKALRKAGALDGWYQENGSVFVIFRRVQEMSTETLIAAGSMRSAWGVFKSGEYGPLVFQMRREEAAQN